MPNKTNRQTPIQSHINRIGGQVNGIKKMIEVKKDNILIIRQIMAAKSSLEQLGVRLLKEESKVCNKTRIDKIVDTLFRLR